MEIKTIRNLQPNTNAEQETLPETEVFTQLVQAMLGPDARAGVWEDNDMVQMGSESEGHKVSLAQGKSLSDAFLALVANLDAKDIATRTPQDLKELFIKTVRGEA